MTVAPGAELIRLADSVLWELRRFWASGRRVSLSLTDRAGRRVEGQVEAVSGSGARVRVNGLWIDPVDILAVHRPVIMGEDTTHRGGDWHFESRRVVPQAEELPGIAGRGEG
jgi:hypothetical protein